jgi:uncharacterized lipoprotein YddW (UPF0748 family)
MSRFEVRGVWGNPSVCGKTRQSVAAYLDRLREVGINAVFMNLKGGGGHLYWPSAAFPQCVAPGYGQFDLPGVLLEECHKRNMQAHAWMFDFYEGESGPAFREHPEWAMRDPEGRTTADEPLRGKRWGPVWMCPARRPGYTDQWLVPIYEEFASRYEFDTIHHDYIRYPGDAAPDRYCFCDHCLEDLPRWAGYLSEAYPDQAFFHEKYDRGYIEAHWEQSPKVIPANWERLPQAFKARFLLEGTFFQGGRSDLDYFFYLYRTHWITRFAEECHKAVKSANHRIGISAAVFKNPIHSGRFIGQDWRSFGPYVDIAIPMDYRDHFPGSFEQYLALLGESIERQKDWASRHKALYVGIAINFLFKEEPGGPYPPGKLERVVAEVESSGVSGIVLFCDDQLERYGMWEAARRAFGA